MAATYRTSAADGGTSGTGNRTCAITPAIGDLLVVFCSASDNTNAAPTCTDNNGGTYDLIGTAAFGTSAHMMSVFVRTVLVPNTTVTTITPATGSNSAAEVVVVAVAGMTRTGTHAIRSSGKQTNQAGGVTPAPVLSLTALTGNLTIGAVANSSNPGGLAPPGSWTERQDVGQATPNTGLEVVSRNSGFTGTTVTWASSSGSDFAAYVLEFDDRALPTFTSITPASGTSEGNTLVVLAGTLFDADATVTFAGTTATSIVVDSATQITCRTPAGTGLVDVTVAGQATRAASFSYRQRQGFGFEESILAISPVWLKGENGEKFQRMQGREFDDLVDWGLQAVRSAMPGVSATTTSLGLSANDARIERGPNETDAHFIARLRAAVDAHRKQGSPGELLRQLAAYFSPSTAYPIRLVSDRAVWHEYDYGTGLVTKTNVGTNWNWDGTVKPWRGWVIIDMSSAGYTGWDVGAGGVDVGDGHVLGFVPSSIASDLRRIVRAWKPGHVTAQIIVTNSATILRRTDTSPDNPDGDWNVPANRANAASYLGV